MTTLIFLVDATDADRKLVEEIVPDAKVAAVTDANPIEVHGIPDLAILFGGRTVNQVNAMLARLAFDDIIPTLLVVDPELATHIDEIDLPVTDLVNRPLQKRVLKTRIETQLSLSRALRDVEAISAIGQSAAVTDRRVFDTILEYEVRRKSRYGGALSMVAFKLSNPTQEIPLASNKLRDVDTVAPVTRDLAAALLPETAPDGAVIVAERLKSHLDSVAFAVGTLRAKESALDFLTRVTDAVSDVAPGSVLVIDRNVDVPAGEVDWSRLD